MRPEDQLRREAAGFAEQLEGEAAAFAKRINELKAELAEVEKTLQSVQQAPRRTSTFNPGVFPNLNCPICWVRDEQQSQLKNLPSDTDLDKWRCDECGFETSTEPI
jgi:hypothetical protein